MFQDVEIDRFIVGRSILPTPKEDTDPFEGQGAHGRLVRLAFIALLLIIDLCPEGMPCGFRRPFHERLSQELWTLEAPVDPGLRAAPCGHRHDPGLCLEVGGGGRAFALFAKGDEQTRGEDRTRSWEGLE